VQRAAEEAKPARDLSELLRENLEAVHSFRAGGVTACCSISRTPADFSYKRVRFRLFSPEDMRKDRRPGQRPAWRARRFSLTVAPHAGQVFITDGGRLLTGGWGVPLLGRGIGLHDPAGGGGAFGSSRSTPRSRTLFSSLTRRQFSLVIERDSSGSRRSRQRRGNQMVEDARAVYTATQSTNSTKSGFLGSAALIAAQRLASAEPEKSML
jgi:hypothetical protein